MHIDDFPTGRSRAPAALFAGCLIFITAATQSGCINALAMMGKVVMGDPLQVSGFEMATGIDLKETESRILVHCSAPSYVTEEYETLTSDVQEELLRRMKRRRLQVVHPDTAATILDDKGGSFDPNLLARELDDVDYIMHIELEDFSYLEDSSPNLYRGRVSGRIHGFETRGEDGLRHAAKMFDQSFKTSHPTTHPVAVDQMPKNVFIRRFVDHIADSLGASFYDVQLSEVFAR